MGTPFRDALAAHDGEFLIPLPELSNSGCRPGTAGGSPPFTLGERLSEGRLESFTTNEDAIVVSYAFATLSPENLHELQTELQEKSADSTINVFFNRAAAV